jgi:uncharacterized protein (DUF427 family)
MKATWKGQVLANCGTTVVVESNHYFPPNAINWDYFIASDTTSHCPWKGDASYYTIVVDGEENKDAAWFYPEPKSAATHIKNYVAFWRGVVISDG